MANDSVNMKMSVNREHDIDVMVLNDANESLEAAAAKFSKDAISDANARLNYQKNIKRISDEVKTLVKNGVITVKEGAVFCNEMRNKIMMETRAVTSPQALATVQKIKKDGKSLEFLLV